MADKEIKIVIPEGIKELGELIKAGRLMIADLKASKDKEIQKIGKSLETDIQLIEKLAKIESVQNFAKELEDVLKLPHMNKQPQARLFTALILRTC